MLTILNIVLLCFATAGTLSAFAGETWNREKKDQPLHHRVTTRGWISLACLFGALALGIAKEFETKAENGLKDAEVAKEKAADRALAMANEKDLSDKLADAQNNLSSTQETLKGVLSALAKNQIQLESVQGDLKTSTASDLINVLGSSGAKIQEVWLIVPSSNGIRNVDEYHEAVAHEMGSLNCHIPSDSVTQEIWIPPENVNDPSNLRVPDIRDSVFDIDHRSAVFDKKNVNEGVWGEWEMLFGRRDIGGIYVERAKPTKGTTISAGSYYSFITSRSAVFLVSADTGVNWEKCKSWATRGSFKGLPPGILVLALDKARNETISFVVKAETIHFVEMNKNLAVGYKIASKPNFMAFPFREETEEFAKRLDAQKR